MQTFCQTRVVWFIKYTHRQAGFDIRTLCEIFKFCHVHVGLFARCTTHACCVAHRTTNTLCRMYVVPYIVSGMQCVIRTLCYTSYHLNCCALSCMHVVPYIVQDTLCVIRTSYQTHTVQHIVSYVSTLCQPHLVFSARTLCNTLSSTQVVSYASCEKCFVTYTTHPTRMVSHALHHTPLVV